MKKAKLAPTDKKAAPPTAPVGGGKKSGKAKAG
jgi:hypothetical protein